MIEIADGHENIVAIDVSGRRLIVRTQIGASTVVRVDEVFPNLSMLSEMLRDTIGFGPAQAIVLQIDPDRAYPDLHRLGIKG